MHVIRSCNFCQKSGIEKLRQYCFHVILVSKSETLQTLFSEIRFEFWVVLDGALDVLFQNYCSTFILFSGMF